MDKALEALHEASISIACAMDAREEITFHDLRHIQQQLNILEDFLNPFTIEELKGSQCYTKPQ
tara:strand:- start:598 stop:786 length:189 start_codon:yes stop_codon:yes gene_type:complete